jgi:hypothetical protein
MSHKNFGGSLAEEKKCTQWLKDREFFQKLWQIVDPTKTITNIEVKEGNFKDFDIEITFSDNTKTTIEIKLDKATVTYGNALIEFWARDAKSGIDVTKSEYWLHIMFSRIHKGKLVMALMKTEHLREIIKANKFPTAKCGDYDKAYGGKVGMGYKIPEQTIFDNLCIESPITFDLSKFMKDTGIIPYDSSKYNGSY